MATTIQEVLGYRNLTGIITDPAGGVPSDILPPAFLNTTRRIVGNTCTYKRYEGVRSTAKRVDYGSPSVRRDLTKVADVPVVLMHSYENQQIPVDVFVQLESTDGQLQDLGKQEIARQVADFRMRFDNLRTSCVWSIFAHGAIYFDGDGNLLPTSSGAVVTIDFAVPADHKTTLGGIIAATWATDTTDIVGQVKALKEQARKDCGYPIKHAFYGANVLEYMASNTAMANLINGNPAYAQGFLAGEIPNGVLGLNWHPANEAFYEDADGTVQDWIGGDIVVFTPEPNANWWEVIQGTFPVPKTLRISGDAMAASSDFTMVSGMFSYGEITTDPPGIRAYAGDTFLPCLKVPEAIFIADVTT